MAIDRTDQGVADGRVVSTLGRIVPLGYLTWSLFRGDRALANPWRATGLEWKTRSPPAAENFDTTPVVTQDPYSNPPPENAEQHV